LGALLKTSSPKAWEISGEEAPQVGLEPTTLRLTAGCSAN
jgi:hypothetical protein